MKQLGNVLRIHCQGLFVSQARFAEVISSTTI